MTSLYKIIFINIGKEKACMYETGIRLSKKISLKIFFLLPSSFSVSRQGPYNKQVPFSGTVYVSMCISSGNYVTLKIIKNFVRKFTL